MIKVPQSGQTTDAMVQLEEGKIKTRRNRAELIREFLIETTGENK